MKAQRRHELQTNSLATWMQFRAPEVWRQYGSRVLLGVVFTALLICVGYIYYKKPEQQAVEADRFLDQVQDTVAQVAMGNPGSSDPAQVRQAAKQAIDASDTPAVQARAHLLLGDYFWAMHNLPPKLSIPVPTTQTRPATGPSTTQAAPKLDDGSEQYLLEAQREYEAVLSIKEAPAHHVFKAHLNLAEVLEDRTFLADYAANYKSRSPLWDEARKHLEHVANSPAAPTLLKQMAKTKAEKQLAELGEPVLFAPAPPSTKPSLLDLANPQGRSPLDPLGPPAPATRPATRPAGTAAPAPATRPATAPAK